MHTKTTRLQANSDFRNYTKKILPNTARRKLIFTIDYPCHNGMTNSRAFIPQQLCYKSPWQQDINYTYDLYKQNKPRYLELECACDCH